MKCPYGKNIHIIGVAGTEGSAILEFLATHFPKITLHAHDFHPEKSFLNAFVQSHSGIAKKEALQKAKDLLLLDQATFHFQEDYLSDIENADTIFVPQSWYLYPENSRLSQFQERFSSITRLYFDLFPGKIIGITGSNGKTTTTTLIGEVMKNAYPKTLCSGNDRRTDQVLESILLSGPEDFLVLEISNRQLKLDLGKSPYISVITNITPNHLLEHSDFEEYRATKASLLKYQKKDQWSVLNGDDPESKKLIEHDDGETFPFSIREILPKGVFVEFGEIRLKHGEKIETLMRVEDFPLLGEHNLANALAATAASYLAKVPLETIARTLRSITPVPQRMELIGSINGVNYYNDTASTAPESTIAALKTLSQPGKKLILMLGGKNKGLDYQELVDYITEKVHHLILLQSPLADEIRQLIGGSVPSSTVETLEKALEEAKEKSTAGDMVILSPAGEYFSYFQNRMPDYKQIRSIISRW